MNHLISGLSVCEGPVQYFATGVRILTTPLYELGRRGDRYRLEKMHIDGCLGIAAVYERGLSVEHEPGSMARCGSGAYDGC